MAALPSPSTRTPDGHPVSQTSGPHNRRFHRIHFEGNAALSCDGVEHSVALVDLSLHGALVRVADPESRFAPGDRGVLCVPLAAELEIRMEVRVMRAEAGELGLVVELIDLESAQHLRRLVELNLGDDALLNRDLAALFEQ